jgi:hypothetical protein
MLFHSQWRWTGRNACPTFDIPDFHGVNPPSSTPAEIFRNLAKEVKNNDDHSQKIEQNRSGLKKGATKKREANVITSDEEKEIVKIVEKAPNFSFSSRSSM